MTNINEQLDKLQEALDKDSNGPSWTDRRHYVSDVYEDDEGRSDRFLPGWWIVPGALAGMIVLFALIMWARS